jgi:hypothetical protein
MFSIFPLVVRRGSGHPRPPSATLSSPLLCLDDTKRTQHNIHGRPIRPGIRTLLTSRWCRKSVALPSTTLPSAPDRHTHTSMARLRFLPSKKSSPQRLYMTIRKIQNNTINLTIYLWRSVEKVRVPFLLFCFCRDETIQQIK